MFLHLFFKNNEDSPGDRRRTLPSWRWTGASSRAGGPSSCSCSTRSHTFSTRSTISAIISFSLMCSRALNTGQNVRSCSLYLDGADFSGRVSAADERRAAHFVGKGWFTPHPLQFVAQSKYKIRKVRKYIWMHGETGWRTVFNQALHQVKHPQLHQILVLKSKCKINHTQEQGA